MRTRLHKSQSDNVGSNQSLFRHKVMSNLTRYKSDNQSKLIESDREEGVYKKLKGVGDMFIYADKDSEVTLFKDYNNDGVIGHETGVAYKNVTEGQILSFIFHGNKYTARFDEDGTFKGYWTGKSDSENLLQYKNPFPVAPWMDVAKGEIGIKESKDTNSIGYKRIKEYYKQGAGQGGLHPTENAWCSSFANWCLRKTSEDNDNKYSYIPPNGNINNPALAINWANKTRYPGGKLIPPDEKVPYGAVMVIQKKGSHEGHVGFVSSIKYEGNTKMMITSLGGNQDNSVNYTNYTFEKVQNDWIYFGKSSQFILLGFVIPQEYEYNGEEYYKYEEVSGKEGASVR